MLKNLNTILCEQQQRVLCRSLNSGKTTSLQQFQQDLSKLKQKIEGIKANNWLLSTDDSYLFLLGFFVLSGLNKTVIICANRKSDWLMSFEEQFDAILSDDQISLKGKHNVDFSFSEKNLEDWYPQLHGQEEITFFTSGSTGLPKAVHKTMLGLTNEVAALESTFGLHFDDAHFVSSVSHLHIYGFLFKLLWPLMTRRSWVNRHIEYPEQLIAIAREHQAFVLISSPAFLSRLDLSLPSINPLTTFSSGGPLSLASATEALQYFSELPIEVYGSTETGGIAYRQQQNAGTPWTVFKDVKLKTTTEGVELTSSYIPENTTVLLDDKLEFSSNGQFILKGRKDRIIKLEEKRISLTEIETFLLKSDTIMHCVALVIPGDRQIIGCVLVLTDIGQSICDDKGFQFLVRQCKQEMKQRFEAVTIPRKWRHISELPINAQSKIDTTQLLAQFL